MSHQPAVENQTTKWTFSSCLVGNKLCPLVIDKTIDDCLRISSSSDGDVLFFSSDSSFELRSLRALAEQLQNQSENVISLRIDSVDSANPTLTGMVIDFTVHLRLPTTNEWRTHVRNMKREFMDLLNAEKIESKALQLSLGSALQELKQVKQRLEWQSKEMDLLKMFLSPPAPRTSPSSSLAGSSGNTDVPSTNAHCQSCQCLHHTQRGVDSSTISANLEAMDESLDSDSNSTDNHISVPVKLEQTGEEDVDVETPDPEDPNRQPEKAIIQDTSNCSSTGVERNVDEEHSTAKQSEDLLWGIAQYILCQLCPEKTDDAKGMESHFLAAHVDKEKRNCAACPSEDLSDISLHVQQHTNRVYACEFCGKRGRKHFLKSHIRTHTGEKPFGCETCGRSFADASTLRRHRLVHSGEKKHSCPICGRGIARKDNVKVHIRSHGLDAVAEAAAVAPLNVN